MNIASTRIAKKETSALPPKKPGFLVGIEHPSPALALAAQKVLHLESPPQQLFLGIPSATVRSDEFDRIVGKFCLTGAEIVSKHLAAAGPSVLKNTVDFFWVAVNCGILYQKWSDPKRNVPSLLIESTDAGRELLSTLSGATGMGQSFFGNTQLQDQIGLVFTAANAAAKGEDISMALSDKIVRSTDTGAILKLIEPVIDAATNVNFKGVEFRPMPTIDSTGS